MGEYQSDREWSDRFIPTLKSLAGSLLLESAPYELDTTENTDLIVLKPTVDMSSLRIACRVRKNKYIEPYGREFTVRSKRDSGAETELAKIMNGFGTWLIYGFEETVGKLTIRPWYCIDLARLRAFLNECGYPNHKPPNGDDWVVQQNRDDFGVPDGTWFTAFRLDRVWKRMLRASHIKGRIELQ